MKILLSTFSALLLLTFLPQAKGSEPLKVLHLTYTGETKVIRDVFITPSAFKISSNSGMTLVAKAPKWDACVSNAKSKMMYRIPYARWKQIGLGIIEGDLDPPKAEQKIDKSPDVMLLSTVHYRSAATLSDDLYRVRHKPRKCVIDYFGTTELPITDDQRRLFALWFGIPSTKELPLLWSRTYESGEKRYVVQILAWKREPYNERAFDEPKNYKVAQNTREIYLAGSESTITEMFNSELEQHK